MTQPIELILLRQCSSYLALPIWLMDHEGRLIFYNEGAEKLLGRRFEETGAIELQELGSLFVTTAEDGSPLASDELPIGVALLHRIPAHRRVRITGFDAVSRLLDVTAFPVIGQGDRWLGAVAMFWEVEAG
jgi:PAS domain-containing protein